MGQLATDTQPAGRVRSTARRDSARGQPERQRHLPRSGQLLYGTHHEDSQSGSDISQGQVSYCMGHTTRTARAAATSLKVRATAVWDTARGHPERHRHLPRSGQLLYGTQHDDSQSGSGISQGQVSYCMGHSTRTSRAAATSPKVRSVTVWDTARGQPERQRHLPRSGQLLDGTQDDDSQSGSSISEGQGSCWVDTARGQPERRSGHRHFPGEGHLLNGTQQEDSQSGRAVTGISQVTVSTADSRRLSTSTPRNWYTATASVM